ncbi:FAD assembly factor SdhE, partial [Escherichia coli]|uniref:FAD assembly factor SdhE n=2 Tax=Pseudomonadota TaxID=1224 RepID=UPI0013D5B6B9
MDDTRLKKIRFRAWHRGFREADLILGPFADKHLAELTPTQVDAFEVLLDQPDQDLYAWIVGREPTPEAYDGEVLDLIK